MNSIFRQSKVLVFYQNFAFLYRRQLSTNVPPQHQKAPQTPPTEDRIQSDDVKRHYTPRLLTYPLGVSNPPKSGENSGINSRTWKEKKEDFMDREKLLEKRKKIKSQFATSYFADFSAISKEHKGKSWIAPQALFKADFARYFPNLQGQTLALPAGISDTTSILNGKVSLVSVFSSLWGERQVNSFVDNESVKEVLRKHRGILQKVDINIEENFLKAWLIKLFFGSLRRKVPREDHDKYFIVTRGLTDELRANVGLLNSRVGYVYLLDKDCKIRWAGSGNAIEGERQSMTLLMDRLAELHRKENNEGTNEGS